MALPSARRPPELEEELEEFQQTQKETRFSLKLRINTADIFMAMLVSWCQKKRKEKEEEHLRKREKSFVKIEEPDEIESLSKKEVLKQARRICGVLKIDYSALPGTWLKTLYEGHGVDFTYENAVDKARKKALKALFKAAMRREITHAEMQKKADLLRNTKVTAEAILDELQAIRTKQFELPPSSKYRFHDLTNEPPPPFWTEEYANGIHLHRTLKIVTLDEKQLIVAYYDYSRTLALSMPTGYKSQCHEANNFLSID